MAGNYPEWVAGIDRNGWPECAGIRTAGEIDRSALLRRAGMLKRDLDAVVETLQEEGRISVAKIRKGVRGPKREVYRLGAGERIAGNAT